MISVTQALEPFSDFSDIPPAILEAAAERGTEVHRICAALARGEFVPYIRPDCRGYVQSFQAWFADTNGLVVAVEFAVRSKIFNLIGHPDLLIFMPGEIWLIDLKTPATPARTWGPQLAAYKAIFEEDNPPVDRAFPLILRKDGKRPKAGPDATPNDLKAFHCALGAYRYFKG